MSIKRFTLSSKTEHVANLGPCEIVGIVEHLDGPFVQFSDHAAALSSREAHIKELEGVLKHAVRNCPNCEGKGDFTCGKCKNDTLHDCQYCAIYRQALSPEGERK